MNIRFQTCLCVTLLTVASTLISFPQTVEARQFRRISPIPVAPSLDPAIQNETGLKQVLPSSGALLELTPISKLLPIDNRIIADNIRKIVKAWNTEGLEHYLDEYFSGRFQLLSTLQRDLPRDASLQILSIRNTSTLSQYWGPVDGVERRSRISNVVATVNLQVRFTDPFKGVVILPHISQFYLRMTEKE